MLKILLLPGAHHSPSARFRIKQYYNAFKAQGYSVKMRTPTPDRVLRAANYNNLFWQKVNPRVAQFARLISMFWNLRDFMRFDIVICNRDIVPDTRIFFFEDLILKCGTILIVDIDDAVYLGDRRKKMNKIFSETSYIVVGNQNLYNYVSDFNTRVSIIPTVIDVEKVIPKKWDNEIFTIGWIGSSGPAILHLPFVYPILRRLNSLIGNNFRFLVVSDHKPKIPNELLPVCDFEYWNKESENKLINRMSVGLMPLPDNEFERGKCGFKAIQYMASGLPAIVSPVGVNSDIVDHGINGFQCRTEKEWLDSLLLLYYNRDLCIKLGNNGRLKVQNEYSLGYSLEQWSIILNKFKKG